MLQAILSVQRNAPDARTLIFVHAYPSIEHIPSELHPNTRLLDEAFPTITIEYVPLAVLFPILFSDLTNEQPRICPGYF